MRKNNLHHIYRAIAYLRLSVDDGDAESESIKNQRTIINRHKEKLLDVQIVGEKVDDGYTGTNFNRPGFKQMIELIKAGKIDCIIVKDLSRLGRDFVEVLRYVQRRFPEWGVRFIAINDNYDSADEACQTDFLSLPIKSLFNESYPANTSISIRNTLQVMREKGLFVGAYAYYGYMKDPEDRHRLILDPIASEVVRDIFRWSLSGFSLEAISARLDSLGILPPADYKISQGIRYKTTFKKYDRCHWTPVAVARILRNMVYLGILIQGKTTTPNYKTKKIIYKSEDDWDIVAGAIPPLVSWIDYMIVNHLLDKDTRTAPGQETVYLFSGILQCEDCKQSLIRKSNKCNGKEYSYYVCGTNKVNKKLCSPHRVSAQKLENNILLLIQYHISLLTELQSILRYVEAIPFADRKARKNGSHLEMLKKDYQRNLNLSAGLYGDYKDGILTKEEYLRFKEKYAQRCEEIEGLIEHHQEENQNTIKSICGKHNWIEHFLKFGQIESLDRKIVVSFIKNIYVTNKGNLEVEFWFDDEYKSAIDKIQQINMELPNPQMSAFLMQIGKGGVKCG